MIIFEKIRFKNLLSYGNSWTEFNFEKGITRLAGKNGNGKSAIISAFYYCLFGKTYTKIKFDQLINSINKKELKTELFFNNGTDKFKIERGLKPNYFYIYKNDVLVSMDSTTRSYQQVLEESILGFNENLFNQISLKSISKDFSFLSLSKSDKRKIVENIFDVEFFSNINVLSKSKADKIESELSHINKDIEYNELLVEQEKQNLEKLQVIKNQILSEQEKQAEESINEIKKLNEDNVDLQSKIDKIEKIEVKLKETIQEIKNKREKLRNFEQLLVQIDTTIETTNKQRSEFEEICGSCENVLKFLKYADLSIFYEKQKTVNDKIEHITSQIKEMQEYREKMENVIGKKIKLEIELSNNNRRITELKKQAYFEVQEKIDIDNSKLEEYANSITELTNKYNEKSKIKSHYHIIKNLCSDEGIKSFIIKKYLPYINKFLNSYLQKFHTDILFYFDSEFNEIIGTKFKEKFSYESFSEGQKRRIDLAILFTFMEFCKARSQKANTNILLLDEISSMLDSDGENYLYDILSKISNEENKCILTISHSMAIDPNKIKNLYQVEVEKGFSQLKKVMN